MRTVHGPIYTLRPFERGIQETLGKYSRFVMPGLGFQIPIVHVVRVRSSASDPLRNDSDLLVTDFVKGIEIECVRDSVSGADEDANFVIHGARLLHSDTEPP